MRALALVVLLLGAASACKFPDLGPVEGDDDDGGDGGPETDATDADLQVPQPLSVTVTGDGTVTSDPGGISCPGDCENDFDPLSTVTLSAEPAASSVFDGWSGDCSGTGDCTLTMDGAKNATARFVAHGAVRWVKQIGFPGDDFSFDTAVDAQGNVVVAGTVNDGNDYDLFAIKYRQSDGEVVWMKLFDTPETSGEFFGDVAVDADGNVYIGAKLQGGTVMYDGVSLTGDIFGHIIVLRLAAATGTVEWGKSWGGAGVDYPNAIAVSGANVYVAGYSSSNPSTFDTLSFPGSVNNGFVVRANAATGAAIQLKHIVGTVELNAIAVNGADVAVVGTARAASTIDTMCSVSPSSVGYDVMVLDLNSTSLACRWAKTYGSSTSNEDAFGAAIAAFPGGGWALTGYFEGALGGFGGSSLGSAGLFDVFAARLNGDGSTGWAFRYGGAGGEVGRAVAATPEGNVLFSGGFSGNLTLGTFTVSGTNDGFVTRLSSAVTPTHEWAVSLGGADSDSLEDIAVGPDGSVYVVASFMGQTNVGSTPLSSQGLDVWVAGLVR